MFELYAIFKKFSVHSSSLNRPHNIGASIIILNGSNIFLSLRYLKVSKSIIFDCSELESYELFCSWFENSLIASTL